MIKINGVIFGNEHFGNNEAIYREVELNDKVNEIELWFEGNEDIATMMFALPLFSDVIKFKKSFIKWILFVFAFIWVIIYLYLGLEATCFNHKLTQSLTIPAINITAPLIINKLGLS